MGETYLRIGDKVVWTCKSLHNIPIQARIVNLCDVAPGHDANDVVPGAELELLGLNGATTRVGAWRNEFAPLAELEVAND